MKKSESVPNLQAVLREEAPVYSAEQRSKDAPQVSVTATESEKQTDEKPQAPAVEAAATIENVKQASMFEEQGALEDQALRELRIVGQVFQTYWILQYEDAMYLVDQHAAHEKSVVRTLYETTPRETADDPNGAATDDLKLVDAGRAGIKGASGIVP